jgi:parvulin-like peptidyl-prolyl isomerase
MTDEDLQGALDEEGLTMAEYRNLMERDLLKRAITTEEILAGQSLTQAELRQYYEANPDEFLTPAPVTLREIFLPVGGQGADAGATAVAGQDEAIRDRLAAVRARIVAGEDMIALVAEVSESGSKANGGLIGPVNLDDINPALRVAVESLAEGEISEPIRMASGYHLFRMETKTEPEVQPFETVRDQIYQSILMSRADVETEKYLLGLRAQAVIEWKDTESQALYQRGLEARQSADDNGRAPRP